MAQANREASSTQAKIELLLKFVIELANHPFSESSNQPSTSVCGATNALHRMVTYQVGIWHGPDLIAAPGTTCRRSPGKLLHGEHSHEHDASSAAATQPSSVRTSSENHAAPSKPGRYTTSNPIINPRM